MTSRIFLPRHYQLPYNCLKRCSNHLLSRTFINFRSACAALPCNGGPPPCWCETVNKIGFGCKWDWSWLRYNKNATYYPWSVSILCHVLLPTVSSSPTKRCMWRSRRWNCRWDLNKLWMQRCPSDANMNFTYSWRNIKGWNSNIQMLNKRSEIKKLLTPDHRRHTGSRHVIDNHEGGPYLWYLMLQSPCTLPCAPIPRNPDTSFLINDERSAMKLAGLSLLPND